MPIDHPLPDYTQIASAREAPVVTDWRGMDAATFAREHAHTPVVLAGLGRDSRAFSTWDAAYFTSRWKGPVKVGTKKRLGERLHPCEIEMGIREFVSLLEGPEPVYAHEWYFFRQHPEALRDLVDGYPAFLLDDWMELIPRGWAFATGTRNNLYWGSDGTSTACHYDTLNAVTWNTTLRGTKRWLLFSCRGVPRHMHQAEVFAAFRKHGLFERGFVTPATFERYHRERPPELPPVEVVWADVPAGSTIYVPWKWAHQVHNQGECLAFSRYYISADNYEACCEFIEAEAGPIAARVFRALVGSETRRRLLGSAPVRRVLESHAVARAFQVAMRLAGVGVTRSHFLVPDAKRPGVE